MGILGCLYSLCGRSASTAQRVKLVYPVHNEPDPDPDKLKQLINWGMYGEERFLDIRRVLYKRTMHHLQKEYVNKISVDLKIYDKILKSQCGYEFDFASDLSDIIIILCNQKQESINSMASMAVVSLTQNTRKNVFIKTGEPLMKRIMQLQPEVCLPLIELLLQRPPWEFKIRREIIMNILPLMTIHTFDSTIVIEIVKLIVDQSPAFELFELFTGLLTLPKEDNKEIGKKLLMSSEGRTQEHILAGIIYLSHFQSHTDLVLLNADDYLDQIPWKFEPSPVIFAILSQFLTIHNRDLKHKELCYSISNKVARLCKTKEDRERIKQDVLLLSPTDDVYDLIPVISAIDNVE